MNPVDRFSRALFVALGVGTCWAIRGSFGHVIGAMLPGVALGLGFAYVTGQRSMLKWMPIFGALAGLGISIGGMMSYGILHGYAKADHLPNYAYGFLTLFMQGGAWGIFGCAALGLLLESRPVREFEWASLVLTILLIGFAFYTIIVSVIGFDVNPPRSNLSVGFTGGAIGLLAWLILHKRYYGLKGAILGYIGFGIGMSFGRVLGNACHQLPFSINNWNVMEYFAGFFGGLIFTFGMLGKRVDEPPRGYGLASIYGALYCLAGVAALHRFTRIDYERWDDWVNRLASYQSTDPENPGFQALVWLNNLWHQAHDGPADVTQLGVTMLVVLNAMWIIGAVAALIWMLGLLTDKFRLGALPVLILIGTMLVFENVAFLFFLRPYQENRFDTKWLWWGSYGIMVLYALIRSLIRHPDAVQTDEVVEKTHWLKWATLGIFMYGLTLLVAHYVNGKETMDSANSRFPIWSHRDKTPPPWK